MASSILAGKAKSFLTMRQPLVLTKTRLFRPRLRSFSFPSRLAPLLFPSPPPPPHTHTHTPHPQTQSIAPTAEEEEELDACDAWVAALVDAEIADEQQEAFFLEQERREGALASAVAAVSVH